MAERVVDAGQLSLLRVVQSSRRDAVPREAVEKLRVAQGGRGEAGILVREQRVSTLAAVTGARAPVAPLEVARAPAVVPRAVGQQELEVRAHRLDERAQHLGVVRQLRVEGEVGQGLLDVVPEVDGAAPAGRQAVLRLALAEEQLVLLRDVGEAGVRRARAPSCRNAALPAPGRRSRAPPLPRSGS